MKSIEFRVDYKDDIFAILDKCNIALLEAGISLEFNPDGLEHDGYEIIILSKVKGKL